MLPTIVIAKRYFDVWTSRSLRALTDLLIPYGYDTLGVECPAEYTPQQVLDYALRLHERGEQILAEANLLLDSQGINLDLTAYDMRALANLMNGTFHAENPVLCALMIKSIPANKLKHQVLTDVHQLQVLLKGIDISEERLREQSHSEKSLHGAAAIQARSEAQANNLIALRRERRGIIAGLGSSHIKGVIDILRERGQLSEFIFLCPHSFEKTDASHEADVVINGVSNMGVPVIDAADVQIHAYTLENEQQLQAMCARVKEMISSVTGDESVAYGDHEVSTSRLFKGSPRRKIAAIPEQVTMMRDTSDNEESSSDDDVDVAYDRAEDVTTSPSPSKSLWRLCAVL